MTQTRLVAFLSAAGLVLSVNATAAPEKDAASAELWLSTESSPQSKIWFEGPKPIAHRLEQQPNVEWTAENPKDAAIHVDSAIQYQTILGLGSSIEESTVFNLSRMSVPKRTDLIKAWVDPETGIGMSLMRITLGSSDFSTLPWYSYDDEPRGKSDLSLGDFSIQKDIDKHLVSTVREALALNPNLKIFASPWSPPGWMKDSGRIAGGSLLPRYYAVAAAYYRKAIEAYQAQGIPIYGMTLQNEPGVSTGYPSCSFTKDQEKAFLKVVRAEFSHAGLKTQLWILDHNFDMAMDYAGEILKDPEAYAAAGAVAFHGYAGEPEAMSKLHERFPEKQILFTEGSMFGAKGMDTIVQIFRNGASSYNAWVTMLDSDRRPNSGPFTPAPTLVIQNAKNFDQTWWNADYYLFGQFTRFIKPGARRIFSDPGSKSRLTTVSFLNPDQTIVTIVVNQTHRLKKLRLVSSHRELSSDIPGGSVATFRWNLQKEPPTHE